MCYTTTKRYRYNRMNRKYLHHVWSTRIKPIHPAYLIVAFLLAAGICTVALRDNNLGMVKLRDAVYAADEKNQNVEQALRDLRSYVYAHMNTNLASGETPVYPPIQLKYTYQRLVEADQKRAAETAGHIYSDAQAECERRYPDSFSGGPRVPCIQQYVSDHGVKTLKIPDSMYKFDFSSPSWSPDLAGWSLLASIFLGALAVIRIAFGYIAKNIL